jgi:hypothetical protein
MKPIFIMTCRCEAEPEIVLTTNKGRQVRPSKITEKPTLLGWLLKSRRRWELQFEIELDEIVVGRSS